MKLFNSQNIYLISTLLVNIESAKLLDIQLKDTEITFFIQYNVKNERKFANTIKRFESGEEKINASKFGIVHHDLQMIGYLLRKGKISDWRQFNFRSVSKHHILSADHVHLRRMV